MAFRKACMEGNIAEVKRLHSLGVPASLRDQDLCCALHWSVMGSSFETRQFDVVHWAIAQGLDVNATNKRFETPLFLAVRARFTTLLDFLFVTGADPNIANEYAQSCLHMAAWNGDLVVINALLKRPVPAHINALDADGKSPLDEAELSQNLTAKKSVVEALKAAGALRGKDVPPPVENGEE